MTPDWDSPNCSDVCNGHVLERTCSFSDGASASTNDPSSYCHVFDCLYGGLNCQWDTEDAIEHWDEWCTSEANHAGGYAWFVPTGCDATYDGSAAGEFYCSYEDIDYCT